MDNGTCAEPLMISCDEAYVQASTGLLLETFEPPILNRVSNFISTLTLGIAAARSTRTAVHFPAHYTAHPSHQTLLDLINQLSTALEVTYPNILPRQSLLQSIVDASEEVANALIDGFKSRADFSAVHMNYSRAFIEHPGVKNISSIIRSLIKHISNMESNDHGVKKALFGNLVSLVHAWNRVFAYLSLPPVLIRHSYVEFLTEAVKFVPTYEQDETKRAWSIYVVQKRSQLTLPLFPSNQLDAFPLSVLDLFNISLSTSTETAMEAIATTIERASEQFRPDKVSLARAGLYYMRNFPGISGNTQQRFCDRMQSVWPRYIESLPRDTRDLDGHNSNTLIELFRLCGKQYMGMDFRVRNFLPIVVAGSREWVKHEFDVGNLTVHKAALTQALTTIAHVPIYVLRNDVRILGALNGGGLLFTMLEKLAAMISLKFYPGAITAYLNAGKSVTPDLDAARAPIMLIGVVNALLMVDGDTQRVLQHLLRLRKIQNIYLDSYHVRAGFCKVIDCIVLETMFDHTEYLGLLHELRQRPVLKPNGFIIH